MMGARALAVALAAASLVPIAAQTPVFRSSVDSVVVDVSVRQRGAPVTDLGPADFLVTENGVGQALLDVSRETLPIDVTLIVDLSASIRGSLFTSLKHAIDAVNGQLRPGDRSRLVTFNHRVTEIGPFAGAEGRSLPPGREPTGSTSLFDAVAASIITPLEPSRRQMAIVFTDGQDVLSLLGESDVVEVAKRSGVTIFAVAMARPSVFGQGVASEALLHALAETTGGVFTTSMPDGNLGAAFVKAFDEFRTSYVLRYDVSGTPRAGWHDLAVRVTRPGEYEVRARKGYFGVNAP